MTKNASPTQSARLAVITKHGKAVVITRESKEKWMLMGGRLALEGRQLNEIPSS